MKIIITNTVALNGGDYAILKSIIDVLRTKYGPETEFLIYDSHAKIAQKYYPEYDFKLLLFRKYGASAFNRFWRLFFAITGFTPVERMMLAAKFFNTKNKWLSNLILTKKEKEDLYNYHSADLIISTGGTYLVENYSLDSRIFDYEFTLALNKPLVFFTQSLGPFKEPGNKRRFKRIFDRAELILLRDRQSLDHLKEINVDTSKSFVCSDIVFSDTSVKILDNAKKRQLQEPLRIGISVRNWKHFNGRSTEFGIKKYFNSVAAICEDLVLNKNAHITFISTCQGIKDYTTDDSLAAKDIFDLLSPEVQKNVYVDSKFHKIPDFKKQLQTFDLYISTRMHGAIEALNEGVPVLPIAYEFKTKELFKPILEQEMILDIDNIEESQAVTVVRKYIDQLPLFREEMFEIVKSYHISAISATDHLKIPSKEVN